jgi:hypothetical protein
MTDLMEYSHETGTGPLGTFNSLVKPGWVDTDTYLLDALKHFAQNVRERERVTSEPRRIHKILLF